MMTYQAKSIGDQLHKVRQMYEAQETQNKVVDGAISFPEERQSLSSGITVEFRYVLFSSSLFLAADLSSVFRALRNVSFRYPTKDDFALRDVSFKVEKGQLCVSEIHPISMVFS
jgi:ABC-type multidrug transport system fused ATPase/permease subunit